MANPPRPRSQNSLRHRLVAFANTISEDPARYNLSQDAADEIRCAVDAFAEALDIAGKPDLKTIVTVRKKDDRRRIAEELHSRYYNQIKADPDVSDADKIAIGVKPVNLERTPIRVPGTVPLIDAIGAKPFQHELRYHDTLSPDSPRKPVGAVFLQLYAAVGDEDEMPLEDAREVGLYARNPIKVRYEAADRRRQATYYARWISRKGEAGLWSLPVSMAIVA